MKNHFTHKGLFGSQTKCFMANPILSDSVTVSIYPVSLVCSLFSPDLISSPFPHLMVR